MPYTPGNFDQAHLYLQWGGKLPGGETWSNGLRFYSTSGAVVSPNDQNAMITGCKTAINAFHIRAGTGTYVGCQLSFVKLNAIEVDGTYAIDTTTQQVVADVPGTVSGYGIPNQQTVAATLETGFSRGPAHRGRIYLPMVAYGAGADGLLSVADATSIKTSLTTLFTALNAVNAGYKLAVFSRKSGAAAHRVATGFSVGRVIDTQRRRRRSLVENYV